MPNPEPGPGTGHGPALVLIGAVLLLWPTLLNWHPYLFWDTYGYFLQGKVYTQILAGLTGWGPVPAEASAGWLGAAGRMLADDASIRSPTWSLVTYLLAALGSFWLLAAANALVAAATIEIVLTRLFDVPPRLRLLVFGGLALLSSLPWFASYMMPDLYAGLLILAAAALAFGWASLRPVERCALLGLYVAAITFHPSHLLLALGLSGVALLLPGRRPERGGRLMRLGLPALAAAGLLLAIGWSGFGEASLTPRGPPFLLARSWEDGPARDYLAAACPEAGWAICAELDRLAPSAQEFLWRPADSYWNMSRGSAGCRACRGKGHPPARRPGRPSGSASGLARQCGPAARPVRSGGFRPWSRCRGDRRRLSVPLPAQRTRCGLGAERLHRHALCHDHRGNAGAGHRVVAIRPIGLRKAGWRCSSILGLLLNAAICGVLSGPHPRYQSRVVWLLPLLAAGLLLGARPTVSRFRDAPGPPAP